MKSCYNLYYEENLQEIRTGVLCPLFPPAEVLERLLDGELPVESELLRHVADPRPGHPGLPGARGTSEHEDTASVYESLAYNALEQCCLATAAGSCQHQTVSNFFTE